MPFKFKTFGARGYTCQVDRIDQGFKIIGGIQDDYNPDFIYCNDSGYYNEAISYRKDIASKAKLILNVLDVPEHHLPNVDLAKTYKQLTSADLITSISDFVGNQIFRYFSLQSKTIYNPIKDVSPEKRQKNEKPYEYKAVLVGRLRDSGKRSDLAIQSLIMAGYNENEVAVCGSEQIGWGQYLGVVTDSVLNDIYNSVDFVMMTSSFEGLGLPAIEGMICGAIPVVCYDMPTFGEIYPGQLGQYPSKYAISYFLNKLNNDKILMETTRKFCLNESQLLLKKFGKTAVAQKILEVYYNIP